MLRKRLITALTFFEGVLFRSKLFIPDYRYTANFVDAWAVDELVVLDISRPENRNREQFIEVLSELSRRCFVPLCVGGGVRSLDDITDYLNVGADKIIVNTAAFDQPKLISEAASRFGSQCIVASIDVRLEKEGYRVYRDCGREQTDWRPEELARYLEALGAGEVFLTSIDKDGSLEGYDNVLNRLVSESISIPLIVCGGAGKWQDFVDGFIIGGADAVATTNIYHFTDSSIRSAKKYLIHHGIDMRV